MRLSKIRIENFRAHSETELDLFQIGCLIGENNAGKSSVLHAVQYVLEDKRISIDDFRDPDLPVSVSIRIEDINEDDLLRVDEKHRSRVRGMVRDGVLTLVRTQQAGDKAEAKYMKLFPRDSLWSEEALNDAISGRRGTDLREAAVRKYPKLDEVLPDVPKQGDVKEAWQELVDALPFEELEDRPAPYPSGIAQSVKPLFPSVIYIEAVKDASVEARSTGTAAFSKLLELLFHEVAGEFENVSDQFKEVHKMLNRSLSDEGQEEDNRLDAVQRIESTIEGFIRGSFPGVSLRMDIPAPTLSMLLAGAELRVDDGHEGAVATKGDGLKRTVLFALLRAYTDVRSTGLNEESSSGLPPASYILLFEEPELYLHPRAQRQLMEALESFSQEHQVLVTTHSPGFFRPGTRGFARLQKTADGVKAHPVDLDMHNRDAYQLVHHENNEAAFFAQRIVLVEGDSDTFTYPHLAKVFRKEWDHVERNIIFVKIGGKGNISRYRRFFEEFDVPVHVIVDLDVLADGFGQLDASTDAREKHTELMNLVGKQVPDVSDPPAKNVKSTVQSRSARELWTSAQAQLSVWRTSGAESDADAVEETLSKLFEHGNGRARFAEIQAPSSTSIAQAREAVISSLAEENVHVLRRGDLEAYCATRAGSDKVSVAMEFCDRITDMEAFKALHGEEGDSFAKELAGIFGAIYGDSKESA